MNVIAEQFRDADAFLKWNEGREGRRELVRGQVVDRTGATRGHVQVVLALAWALRSRLDPARFEVVTNDLGVKTALGVRFPDVLVDRAGGDLRDLAVPQPVLVAEVLSPSSLEIDFVEKAQEYKAIDSTQAYLILAQDEPRAWLWQRHSGGWAEAEAIEGFEGVVDLTVLGIAIPMQEIYANLEPFRAA